jgi:hypothetical protein
MRVNEPEEPALVEAFIPQPPVEALASRVLDRLARVDEAQQADALVSPFFIPA